MTLREIPPKPNPSGRTAQGLPEADLVVSRRQLDRLSRFAPE